MQLYFLQRSVLIGMAMCGIIYQFRSTLIINGVLTQCSFLSLLAFENHLIYMKLLKFKNFTQLWLQVLANRFPLGGSRGLRWSALIPIMLRSLYFLTFPSLSPFLFCFTEKVTDRLQWRSAQWAPGGWREFLGEPGRMLIRKARWVAGGWRRSLAHWALKLLLNSISGNSCGSDTV